MKILQLGSADLQHLTGLRNIIVESQPYGQPTDFIYHVVLNDANADELIQNHGIREIEDKGRTVGFYQNLGGGGIYATHAISSLSCPDIPDRIRDILARQKEATLSFEGKTWKEIIGNMPFMENVLNELGYFEGKVVTKATPRTSKRSSKKKPKKTKASSQNDDSPKSQIEE